jgi:hypothetical protein
MSEEKKAAVVLDEDLVDPLYVLSLNEEAMEEAIQQFEGSSTGEALKCVFHAQKLLRSRIASSPTAVVLDDERVAFYVHRQALRNLAAYGDQDTTVIFTYAPNDNYVPVYLNACAASPQPVEQTRALTEDARDAKRYRWMRSRDSSLETRQRDKGIVNGPSCYHEVEGIRELKWGNALDEAIDAAMTAANPESLV